MRRGPSLKRKPVADPLFNSVLVSQLTNQVLLDGKKDTARNIVYKALDIASAKLQSKNQLDLFKNALNNVKPGIEVRSRRVGGATYQVPVEIRSERAQALAIRWIVDASRGRNEKSITDRLANEFADAHENKGISVKKKEDTHKICLLYTSPSPRDS